MNAETFEEHRSLLFSVAYRMLGTAADAEDAVQDAWLRWSRADVADVRDPKAYLIRIVTNTAVDRLRSAQVKRESYVGPWLPEPMLTSPDVAEDVEMAESVSMAMMVVLETLGPVERAVFVLHEVFGYPYGEVADVLGKKEANVRQIAHRAREHVQARRPRFDPDPEQRRQVTQEFLSASLGGDLDRLMKVLAPDVTLVVDGGGKRRAALRPLEGIDNVAHWLASITRRPYDGVAIEDMSFEETMINGAPGLIAYGGGVPLSTFMLDVVDGQIAAVHITANPDKLRSIEERRELPFA